MLPQVAGSAALQDSTTPDDQAAAASAFTPSALQLAFLHELCARFTEGKPVSNTAVCDAVGISRTTLWTWKHKTPGFNAWLAEAIRVDACGAADWQLVIARAMREAREGSIEHARFLLDIKKLELGAKGGQDAPLPLESQGPTLVFNLPRPPADLVGRTVVRGAVEVTTEPR